MCTCTSRSRDRMVVAPKLSVLAAEGAPVSKDKTCTWCDYARPTNTFLVGASRGGYIHTYIQHGTVNFSLAGNWREIVSL
jgi:hypothetical protein